MTSDYGSTPSDTDTAWTHRPEPGKKQNYNLFFKYIPP